MMLVLLAVLMVVFMVVAALLMDVARVHLARAELRTATDAAAKAAAENLSQSMDLAQARQRGAQIAAQNRVMGRPLSLDEGDISFGHSFQRSESGHFTFRSKHLPLNSVRVTSGRLAAGPDGQIPLLLGNFVDSSWFDVRCSATATYLARDIVLVLDVYETRQSSELGDLPSAIDTFVASLERTPVQEWVGLAFCRRDGQGDVPLSDDLSKLSQAVHRLPFDGNGRLSLGMQSAAEWLRKGRADRFVEKTMVIVANGQRSPDRDSQSLARQLAAEGVAVYSIGLGPQANQQPLQQLAQAARGRHYHAENERQLRQIYRRIAFTLSTIMTE